MPLLTDLHRRWEVRPTLRLPGYLPDQSTVDRVSPLLADIAEALRNYPNVAVAHVGLEFGGSVGIAATIVLVQPSTPGAAVDEVTNLLVNVCAVAGLATDVIKEVVVEVGDVDSRSL